MTDNVVIEGFDWRRKDLFCDGYVDRFGKLHNCGKTIGVWAKKHSHRCQACNLCVRMEKQKAAEIEARVGA